MITLLDYPQFWVHISICSGEQQASLSRPGAASAGGSTASASGYREGGAMELREQDWLGLMPHG